MDKVISGFIEREKERSCRLARDIFESPELALEEYRSSAYLMDYLAEFGFEIEKGIGGLETAFAARYGSGKPVIGILAEYDALPGLGQESVPYRKPIAGPGHGCAHNLLGSGVAVAGAALKAAMEAESIPGTLIVFGCPAEEGLSGKVTMVNEHCFDGVDIAISWHPLFENKVSEESHQAMDSKIYRFYGTTAHAAACPEMGRSALDAAELMNVGVNYLREHVPDHVRMHYCYKSAGEKPNIVPDYAELEYYIRARDRATVADVSARVDDIARGAAMMTGTRAEIELLCGSEADLINTPLVELFYEVMQAAPALRFSEEEKAYAAELRKNNGGTDGEPPLQEDVLPLQHHTVYVSGSTDLANVSRIIPTVTINTACEYNGAPGHHWTITATAGMSIGFRGMLYGAGVMAEAARELFMRPDVIEAAWRDFEANSARK